MYRPLLLAASVTCISLSAKAHEFWIDPEAHIVAPGDTVRANLRVGEDYEGSAYSYIPRSTRRFDYAFQGDVRAVEGRVGDRPAFSLDVEGEGLLVVIHATTDQRITWDEWERFVGFVEHKDIAWALEEHDARGLPREDVRELYSRYAKSLVKVGTGAGTDVEAGMETEIVALENPYTDDMSDGFDIRALYQGEPLADVQVEVFAKAGSGDVTISTVQTDASGEATIPVEPGHRYMLDTVYIRPLDVVEETDPAWETLWANLTFEVPGE